MARRRPRRKSREPVGTPKPRSFEVRIRRRNFRIWRDDRGALQHERI
jgi:hypothetical protein